MATKIFPSVNDINGGVAGQGKTLTEANLKQLQALPYFDKPYVKSGAALTNGGGLNLNVAAGVYCIDGRWVNKDGTESVLLTASATNRVWLQLTKDGSGNVTGTTWNVQTGATIPTDAVLVGEIVTAAATITSITPTFRGVIAPGKAAYTATPLTATSAGAGDKVTLQTCGDGITPVRVEGRATCRTDGAASNVVYLRIHDVASGGGTMHDQRQFHNAAANFTCPLEPRLEAYTYLGAKTFYLNIQNTSGAPYADASASMPASLRSFFDF